MISTPSVLETAKQAAPRPSLLPRLLGVFLVAPLLLAGPARAQSDAASYFSEYPDSAKHVVIITGPTVGEDAEEQFREWSLSLHDALAEDYGYADDAILLLYADGPQSVPDEPRIDGAATREDIIDGLNELRDELSPGDQLTLFLIGHGSGEGEEAKFNIRGPDFTGDEFATLLDEFGQQNLVIVNTSSSSYSFSASLSGEGRVVISATRSDTEKYDPVFSRYFIEALAGRNGDRDKNNRVSMLEAFNYAKASVSQWYEDAGRLASEHAGLDDNGDAVFTLSPSAREADGHLAEIAYIDTLADDDGNLDPEALALKAEMQALERDVFLLRGRKSEFLEADYWQQMEKVLVELAHKAEQFDELLDELLQQQQP